jgi:hypothetical protein
MIIVSLSPWKIPKFMLILFTNSILTVKMKLQIYGRKFPLRKSCTVSSIKFSPKKILESAVSKAIAALY